MRFTRIKETCLYVSDLDATRDFYHGYLHFPVISHVKSRHVFFRVGDSVLLCFLPEVTRDEKVLPAHWAKGPQHIAFEVTSDDYEDIKSGLLQKGIEIIHTEKWRNDDFESFYFADPDGHVLEIVPAGMWD